MGGPALLAAAVAAGVARPASPLVWFLLGAGIVVLVAAAVARTSDRGCVFCGAQRADVTFLVAGPCLSICPDCTAAASAFIAEELERRGKAIEWAPLFLGRLPERSPLELTRPYVELVASRDRSPAGIRGAAGACFRFGQCVLVAGLFFSGIPSGNLSGPRSVEGGAALLFAVLAFGGFSAMGVVRLARGVRGFEAQGPPATQRAEHWYRRHWYAVNLALWLALATRMRNTPGDWPWIVFLALLVLPFHVVVHELGHAAAGALVGFRFHSLRVGWVTLVRHDQGLRLSWSRPTVAGVLGLHAAFPTDEVALPLRRAVHAAAGPAASLAAALGCRLGAQAIGQPVGIAGAVVIQLLGAGFLVGAFLGVVNLLPFRTRSGMASDGANLARVFLRESPAAAASRRFHTQWALGRRPREWGMAASDVRSVARDAGAARESLYLAAAAVALDTGDDQLAGEILQQAVEAANPADTSMRFELELQLVMLDAFLGRVDEARRRLDDLPPRVGLPNYYPSLALAVVVAAEGRPAEATALLESWERGLDVTGRASSIRVGNEWAVERLRQRLGG